MLSSTLASAVASVSKYTPPGVVLGFFSAFLAGSKYYGAWVQEFIGTFLMIGLTFSPGKWVGQSSKAVAWSAHAVGVVMADYIGGGPHVNPAVSVSMFSLGKCDYTEMYVRICGSMTAGLLSFPLFLFLTTTVGLEDLGGPAYEAPENEDGSEGFYNEFLATFLLLVAIYVLNFEVHFGKYHYWIKQPLTALVIRYLIEVFPTTGPSLNPMLGTAWAVFDSEQVGKAEKKWGSNKILIIYIPSAISSAVITASFRINRISACSSAGIAAIVSAIFIDDFLSSMSKMRSYENSSFKEKWKKEGIFTTRIIFFNIIIGICPMVGFLSQLSGIVFGFLIGYLQRYQYSEVFQSKTRNIASSYIPPVERINYNSDMSSDSPITRKSLILSPDEEFLDTSPLSSNSQIGRTNQKSGFGFIRFCCVFFLGILTALPIFLFSTNKIQPLSYMQNPALTNCKFMRSIQYDEQTCEQICVPFAGVSYAIEFTSMDEGICEDAGYCCHLQNSFSNGYNSTKINATGEKWIWNTEYNPMISVFTIPSDDVICVDGSDGLFPYNTNSYFDGRNGESDDGASEDDNVDGYYNKVDEEESMDQYEYNDNTHENNEENEKNEDISGSNDKENYEQDNEVDEDMEGNETKYNAWWSVLRNRSYS